MMRGKKEGILFLIFILFCIPATGFYDRVFDDNNSSPEDQLSQHGDKALDYSLRKNLTLVPVLSGKSQSNLNDVHGNMD